MRLQSRMQGADIRHSDVIPGRHAPQQRRHVVQHKFYYTWFFEFVAWNGLYRNIYFKQINLLNFLKFILHF